MWSCESIEPNWGHKKTAEFLSPTIDSCEDIFMTSDDDNRGWTLIKGFASTSSFWFADVFFLLSPVVSVAFAKSEEKAEEHKIKPKLNRMMFLWLWELAGTNVGLFRTSREEIRDWKEKKILPLHDGLIKWKLKQEKIKHFPHDFLFTLWMNKSCRLLVD